MLHKLTLELTTENILIFILVVYVLYKFYRSLLKEVVVNDKWWLLGFNNKVLDLNEGCIRNYRRSDNITINTGFEWLEHTQ